MVFSNLHRLSDSEEIPRVPFQSQNITKPPQSQAQQKPTVIHLMPVVSLVKSPGGTLPLPKQQARQGLSIVCVH